MLFLFMPFSNRPAAEEISFPHPKTYKSTQTGVDCRAVAPSKSPVILPIWQKGRPGDFHHRA